jgi:hypothetical protein
MKRMGLPQRHRSTERGAKLPGGIPRADEKYARSTQGIGDIGVTWRMRRGRKLPPPSPLFS